MIVLKNIIYRINNMQETLKLFAVTGTYHGSIIYAKCEGDARRTFHKYYGGESILYCIEKSNAWGYMEGYIGL